MTQLRNAFFAGLAGGLGASIGAIMQFGFGIG